MPDEAIVEWYGALSGQLDEQGEAQLAQWLQSLTVKAGD